MPSGNPGLAMQQPLVTYVWYVRPRPGALAKPVGDEFLSAHSRSVEKSEGGVVKMAQ